MNLALLNARLLAQLSEVCELLNDDMFTQSITELSNSTLGQHIRHIIEFNSCFFEGLEGGIVCYDRRKRELRIESDLSYALELMNNQIEILESGIEDKSLLFEACYATANMDNVLTKTTVTRELAYTFDHTVHHMAIIKTGIICLKLPVTFPSEFGVASSTVRFRNECVQ